MAMVVSAQQVTLTAFPKQLQLYPRDSHDSSIVTISGSVTTAAVDSVSVTLYKANVQIWRSAKPLSYSGASAAFSFTPKIHAELSMYKFELRAHTTIVATADSVVCGDAYMIEGQSNAACTWLGGNAYKNPYIRSFGNPNPLQFTNNDTVNFAADTAFGVADGNAAEAHCAIGVWGMQIGRRIVENYKIPVCIINGAVPGTTIETHYRDLSLGKFYGRIYYRISKAGLRTSIRAIMWHQGENNINDPAYKTKFFTLYASWKSDYPNFQHCYIFQVRPGCPSPSWGYGMPVTMEQQRQIPKGRTDISIMSTTNVSGRVTDCHFNVPGYLTFGERLFPLVARDLYGSTDTVNIKPPDIQKAWFGNTAHTQIVLQFDQPVIIPADTLIKRSFAIGSSRIILDSIKADSARHTLTLYGPAVTSSTITYILDTSSGSVLYEGPWLYNTRNVGALAFYNFPINAYVPVTKSLKPTALADALHAECNPGNHSIDVDYSIVKESHVTITVCSVDGKLVATLFTGGRKPGVYHVAWYGNNNIDRIRSSVYVLIMKSAGLQLEKRIVFLK
jgi:hypothetical protein